MMSFAFDVHSTYRNKTIYGIVLSSRPFLSPCDTWKLLRRITDRHGYLNRVKQHVNAKGIYKVSQFSSVFVSEHLCLSWQQLMWFIQLRFSEQTQIKHAYFNCVTFDVVNIVVTVWILEIHMYNPRNKYSELFGLFS